MPIETPIEEGTSKSTGLAVDLDIHELSYLLNMLAPRVVHPLGEQAYIVNLFVKLNTAFHQLEEEAMPSGGESYDKANHIPDRASGNMTKQAGGHAEPATKKPMRTKTVAQVMAEAPHLPCHRDTETAVRKGHGRSSVKENAGS